MKSTKDQTEEKIILGIDPGTVVMGYGLIKATKNTPTLIAYGIIATSKFDNHYQKLKIIYDKTYALIKQYQPDILAIEAPFYGKNIQSMLKLGRAQGAAITAAMAFDIPIFEYAPKKIKVAITGNGNASKEQVSAMLQRFMKYKDESKQLDSSDALAAAVCHYFQQDKPSAGNTYKDWKEFLKKNPDRLA